MPCWSHLDICMHNTTRGIKLFQYILVLVPNCFICHTLWRILQSVKVCSSSLNFIANILPWGHGAPLLDRTWFKKGDVCKSSQIGCLVRKTDWVCIFWGLRNLNQCRYHCIWCWSNKVVTGALWWQYLLVPETNLHELDYL